MSLPRIGFAGVGRIGSRRLHAIADAGTAEIAAVFDVNTNAARQALALAGEIQAPCVDRFDKLLDHDLDGVIISTPNRLHAEQSIQAFDADLGVFCQKPLGCDAVEVGEVVDAARRADRLLGVDLTYRRSPAMQAIHPRATRGDIGHIYAADLVFHNAYGPDKKWFYDRRQSGGGCFLDLGVHLIDLALWTLGYPEVEGVSSRLFAKGEPVAPGDPTAVEDHAMARLDLEGGVTANLACSWHLSAGCNAVIRATFHGTEGTLHMYNINGGYFDLVAERHEGPQTETLVVPNGKWDSGTAIDWTERVGTSNRFEPEAQRHRQIAEVLDRVYSG